MRSPGETPSARRRVENPLTAAAKSTNESACWPDGGELRRNGRFPWRWAAKSARFGRRGPTGVGPGEGGSTQSTVHSPENEVNRREVVALGVPLTALASHHEVREHFLRIEEQPVEQLEQDLQHDVEQPYRNLRQHAGRTTI